MDQVKVTDELKILAASSAVMLLFNRPDLEFPRISEILFYPRAFSGESFSTRGRGRHVAGLNSESGAVVLSVPELRMSFMPDSDGYHVGLHEFAHALDRSGQSWKGAPGGMDAELLEAWTRESRVEREKLKQGLSVMDPYAATNDVEFFAVAVETYFGKARYEVLERYFRASPPSDPPPPRAKRRPDSNPNYN